MFEFEVFASWFGLVEEGSGLWDRLLGGVRRPTWSDVIEKPSAARSNIGFRVSVVVLVVDAEDAVDGIFDFVVSLSELGVSLFESVVLLSSFLLVGFLVLSGVAAGVGWGK